MVVGVYHEDCFGTRLENRIFLDPICCKKSRDKFIRLGRTCELRNHGRGATPIIGGEN
jgi:hypothetical protein